MNPSTSESPRLKVAFLHQSPLSFVVRDLRILQEFAEVQEVRYRGWRDLPALMRAVRDTELVFAWFAKLQAFWGLVFARLWGKKFIVIAGGDDAAWVPELSYGMRHYWYKRWCSAVVLSHGPGVQGRPPRISRATSFPRQSIRRRTMRS